MLAPRPWSASSPMTGLTGPPVAASAEVGELLRPLAEYEQIAGKVSCSRTSAGRSLKYKISTRAARLAAESRVFSCVGFRACPSHEVLARGEAMASHQSRAAACWRRAPASGIQRALLSSASADRRNR